MYLACIQHVEIGVFTEESELGLGVAGPMLELGKAKFVKGMRIALITLGTDRINSVQTLSGITPWARAFFI